jgi:hypothetical protein
MGVKWQPLREPSDRWGFMGQPLTVPHEALIVMQAVMAEQQAVADMPPVVDEWPGYGETAPDIDPDLLDIFAEFDIQ